MSASRLLKVTLMRIFRIVSGAVAALTLVGGLAISEPSAARDRFSPGAAAAVGVSGWSGGRRRDRRLAEPGLCSARLRAAASARLLLVRSRFITLRLRRRSIAVASPSATANGCPAGAGSRVAGRFATDRQKARIARAFLSDEILQFVGLSHPSDQRQQRHDPDQAEHDIEHGLEQFWRPRDRSFGGCHGEQHVKADEGEHHTVPTSFRVRIRMFRLLGMPPLAGVGAATALIASRRCCLYVTGAIPGSTPNRR